VGTGGRRVGVSADAARTERSTVIQDLESPRGAGPVTLGTYCHKKRNVSADARRGQTRKGGCGRRWRDGDCISIRRARIVTTVTGIRGYHVVRATPKLNILTFRVAFAI